MNNSGKQQSYTDQEVDDRQQSNDDSIPVSGEASPAGVSGDSRNGNDIGLAARLTDFLAGDGDGDSDLLIQRDTHDGTVVQWLQALDMQVMGACRADERLKPLLKLNVSSVAEDRLLSHLSRHFEPSEVGLLARCLCIPLVSIRVGKINKQGTRLIPISVRGNLVVSLLPSSDLRISFLGDDGGADRLSILRTTADCSSVVIKEIPTDTSGRSFSLQLPNTTDPSYFWCSEKSKLLGNELLEKMRKLLKRKPSLTELTGISNYRLQSFLHHLVGSMSFTVTDHNASKSPLLASKPSRVKTFTSSIIQGSLSPRPSSFKERNLTSLRNVVRDKSRRSKVEMRAPPLLPSTSYHHEKNEFPSSSSSSSSSSSPIPYYCWCSPPVVVSTTTTNDFFTLPPFSSSSSPKTSSELSLPQFLPLSMPSSQLLTPLMCDPIVHVPVIDVCSQAYLVSIPPLVQESDSEKSARETLRLLLSGSSQFPSVLGNTGGGTSSSSSSCSHEDGSSEGSIE